MQAANSARTLYHPHTTLADRQATSSPVPPDTVPPLPRSRQYLWGSRRAASSGAGVPLPALQRRLQAPAPPGGRGHAGGGAGRRGGAGPGVLRGGKRLGRGLEAWPRSARSAGGAPALSQARPGPASCLTVGLPALGRETGTSVPAFQTNLGARPGRLVLGCSLGTETKCSENATIHEYL